MQSFGISICGGEENKREFFEIFIVIGERMCYTLFNDFI